MFFAILLTPQTGAQATYGCWLASFGFMECLLRNTVPVSIEQFFIGKRINELLAASAVRQMFHAKYGTWNTGPSTNTRAAHESQKSIRMNTDRVWIHSNELGRRWILKNSWLSIVIRYLLKNGEN